ncbi:MAG: EAL domain-containing protein, partial [Desulfovibrio sp.]|nr:EAL domain-containing protein [Desulfovibrio sp.]
MPTDAAISPLEKKTILIVEDNDMNRDILHDLLSDDFNVLVANNGLTGLKMLEENYQHLSIILLDIYMPECNGFEFLERKWEHTEFRGIPVIVMTASNTVEDEIRCLKLGASDFLSKPYNTEVMKNRIRSIIHLKETSSFLNRLEKDALTGLLSKEFFLHQSDNLLKRTPDTAYDLICSDVENFRRMNDRYGVAKCDEFLSLLASRLNTKLPDILLAGRVDVDVFAFLIKHQDGDWAEALLNDVAGDDQPMGVQLKFCLMPSVDHSLATLTLINHAASAIKEIKGHYKTRVAIYDEEFRKKQLRTHLIEEAMPDALKNREFQVYYQPKHSAKDDTIVGAEALVRWLHPKLGFLTPKDFIPLFEQNGFISKLDFYVWEEVCCEIRRCQDIGFAIVPISVNVSPIDFDTPDLAERLISLVDKYQIDHKLFRIELTEAMCVDNLDYIAATCKKLHDAGFVIELDDFGSSYSSLSSFVLLNVDVLKLDVSLVRNASETKNYSLLRYAILLAESMKLETIAEGVEVEEQVMALRVLGCDAIQGYYY